MPKLFASVDYYEMEANSSKVFEWKDFNIADKKEEENIYTIQKDGGLSIEILSSNLISIYRLVRFEVRSPNLWLPKTYHVRIQSKNKYENKNYNIFITVALNKTKWLICGLLISLSSLLLFTMVYYLFSR